jgi:hypothetical protein
MDKRLCALGGIAFVALVVLTLVVSGSTPEPGDDAAAVAAFYDKDEARQFVTSFVFAATVPFLILFAVGLVRTVGDDRNALWGQLAIAGAILAGGVILITAAVHFALLDAVNQDAVAPEAIAALNFLEGSTWVAFNAGFGVMMLGAAGVTLSGSGGRRWLGRVAIVLGIALFIPVADFFALLGMLLWILIVSVVQSRAVKPGSVASSAPAH